MRPARRPATGGRAGALGLLMLALGASGTAAQADKPHRRPVPPPVAAAPTPDGSAPSAAVPAGTASGRPSATDAGPGAGPGTGKGTGVRLRPAMTLPPPVLRSAVHSRWSGPATIAERPAGRCRAVCAETRLSCTAGLGDTSQCDPAWTRCLSTCGALDYARGP